MRKYGWGLLLLGAATLVSVSLARGQAKESVAAKHKVLVEVTADGKEAWEGALNNVENLQKALGAADTQIEVVVHGNALGLTLASNTDLKDRMRKIAQTGVVFAACENTMKRKGVAKADLLPFVATVDSGVAEVVRKQEAGWSYLKTGT